MRGQRTELGEDRRQISLRRCRAVQRTENREIGFRGQSLERTEDRSVCGASRRSGDGKPGGRGQRTELGEDRRQISLRRCRAG
ncbi:MAG: hypothetical protein LBD06_10585 [Candidatus Accumulibacter sp.]|nr:hypothetical protein [Accumulibacter sp.]